MYPLCLINLTKLIKKFNPDFSCFTNFQHVRKGWKKYKKMAASYLNGSPGGHGYENLYNALYLCDKGFDTIFRTIYDVYNFQCDDCPNRCEVVQVFQNNELTGCIGSRCGKWDEIDFAYQKRQRSL